MPKATMAINILRVRSNLLHFSFADRLLTLLALPVHGPRSASRFAQCPRLLAALLHRPLGHASLCSSVASASHHDAPLTTGRDHACPHASLRPLTPHRSFWPRTRQYHVPASCLPHLRREPLSPSSDHALHRRAQPPKASSSCIDTALMLALSTRVTCCFSILCLTPPPSNMTRLCQRSRPVTTTLAQRLATTVLHAPPSRTQATTPCLARPPPRPSALSTPPVPRDWSLCMPVRLSSCCRPFASPSPPSAPAGHEDGPIDFPVVEHYEASVNTLLEFKG